MNFLVKMVITVQNKSIIWLVLDQKRFTGRIGIEFYIGDQSSNFLKFKFCSLQMCYFNVTQKFVWVIERALQNMSTDLANCVIISSSRNGCTTTPMTLVDKTARTTKKRPLEMISALCLLKVTTYLR